MHLPLPLAGSSRTGLYWPACRLCRAAGTGVVAGLVCNGVLRPPGLSGPCPLHQQPYGVSCPEWVPSPHGVSTGRRRRRHICCLPYSTYVGGRNAERRPQVVPNHFGSCRYCPRAWPRAWFCLLAQLYLTFVTADRSVPDCRTRVRNARRLRVAQILISPVLRYCTSLPILILITFPGSRCRFIVALTQ